MLKIFLLELSQLLNIISFIKDTCQRRSKASARDVRYRSVYYGIWMWSQHDIQRLRWTSLRAQYLKLEAWSETAKLTHSLQMINPSVLKCLVIAREEKRVLLWTVTDINCMCLNFIFTGFSVGDRRGEPVRR